MLKIVNILTAFIIKALYGGVYACSQRNQSERIMRYHIVEKNNPLTLHAICETQERAEHWIKVKAPEYCAKGLFMDKTLTPDSFEIVPADYKRKK